MKHMKQTWWKGFGEWR